MSRIARLLGMLTVTFAALAWPATIASAALPAPEPRGLPRTLPGALPTTTVITHTTSGLAVWVVILIAVASVAAGIALTELFQSMRRRAGGRGLATA
jgi:hypothetical protein